MCFTQQLWQSVKPIFIKATEHPFAQKLSQGSLELSAFQSFLAQDVLYLQAYAQTLTLLAQKAQVDADKTTWLNFAEDTNKLITTFEQHYFPQYAVTPAASPTKICSQYTLFLLHTAKQCSYSETLAAIAPCFIFYYQVGKTIAANSPPNNPYANWITHYCCPFFANDVNKVTLLINQAALASSQTARNNMQKLFIQACEFELAFMDSAYQQEPHNTATADTQHAGFWQTQASTKSPSSFVTIPKTSSYD